MPMSNCAIQATPQTNRLYMRRSLLTQTELKYLFLHLRNSVTATNKQKKIVPQMIIMCKFDSEDSFLKIRIKNCADLMVVTQLANMIYSTANIIHDLLKNSFFFEVKFVEPSPCRAVLVIETFISKYSNCAHTKKFAFVNTQLLNSTLPCSIIYVAFDLIKKKPDHSLLQQSLNDLCGHIKTFFVCVSISLLSYVLILILENNGIDE